MDVKGIIALDIDGTVTDHTHHMPQDVHDFLEGLAQKGWVIAFITGRTFDYGYQTLKSCKFSYIFCVFNGALMFKMPEREVIKEHHLDSSRVPEIVQACAAEGLDPIFHEIEGNAYWRPSCHDPEASKKRIEKTGETWVAIENFDQVGRKPLAYAKIFGLREVLLGIVSKLQGLASEVIHDPLRPGHSVMLVTHPQATKGGALRDLREMFGKKIPAIAAGDDYNDLTMIKEADIGIVMETAPDEIKAFGDLIGADIVDLLKKAIK